jgi:putative transposase
MTAPRPIHPGTTYMITRRCSERRFFLKPGPIVNAIFQYVLALASARYGIAIHAYCVLSNHVHIVLTDPDGCLPEFNRYLDGLVARAVNAFIGHWESFWDPGSVSQVVLETPEAILEKMTYVLANPVAAGLVRRAAEWPGLWSAPTLIGAAIIAKRPEFFFDPKGYLPPTATIQLCRPPGFEDDEHFVATLTDRIRSAEDDAAAELGRAGRSFLGAARVLAQKPFARPAPGEPRRQLSPRVACRNKWKRIEALRRVTKFVAAYKAALAAWRAGDRTALFPAGTWQMRVQHAAACCAPA